MIDLGKVKGFLYLFPLLKVQLNRVYVKTIETIVYPERFPKTFLGYGNISCPTGLCLEFLTLDPGRNNLVPEVRSCKELCVGVSVRESAILLTR